MKTQNILIAHPSSEEEMNTIKAFFEALKIKFEVTKEAPYDAEFVERVLQAKEEIKEGKGVKIATEDLWK